MFKWKVSRLGGSKKERNKQKLNNESSDQINCAGEDIYAKNNNVINKERNKDSTSSPSPKKFGIFPQRQGGQDKADKENGNNMTLSRVGQRLAVPHPANTGLALSSENLLSEIPPPLPLFGDSLPSSPVMMGRGGGEGRGDMPPPVPPLKPEWRSTQMQRRHSPDQNEGTEALPSDSLYAMHRNNSRAGDRAQTYMRPKQQLPPPPPPHGINSNTMDSHNGDRSSKLNHSNSRGQADFNGQRGGAANGQSQADLAHWSSHGYLAKADGPEASNEKGYIVLKRQQLEHRQSQVQSPGGDRTQHTLDQSQSPLGYHEESRQFSFESGVKRSPSSPNKYFSVKGFQQMVQLHKPQEQNEKYFSVDASFLSNNPDARQKIRQSVTAETYKKPEFEGLYSNSEKQRDREPLPEYIKPPPPPITAKKPVFDNSNPPPLPPYQRPPPPKGLRDQQQPQHQNPPLNPENPQRTESGERSNLADSKNISGSVSWLEWTQQLQAYIAWVNSQLRKRPGLKPVKDLRTDLQSGEVLAQLIEIISGEELYGIQYKPESLQGMRENLERVLQFMGTKHIKMHNITARELLEGNLKSVMRLILALAAHYKPQSVKHHDTSMDSNSNSNQDNIHKTTGNGRVADNDDVVNRYKKRQPAESPKTSVETQTMSSIIANRPHPHNNNGPSSLPVLPLGPLPPPPGHFNNLNKNVNMLGSTANSTNTSTSTSTSTANTSTESNTSSVASPRSPTIGLQRGLTNEGFVRSGSGRKLPQIPERNRSNTLPTRKPSEGDDDDDIESGNDLSIDNANIKIAANNKNSNNKPKALEFWESMENLERNDFRYNTIHRMSVGRRMLPKPPNASDACHSRSQSIDRGDDKSSLNSSFASGPASLPIHSVPHSPRGLHKKIPPDGASLQSENSGSDMEQRREGEGSSDKNSPPTSVVLLGQADTNLQDKSYEWESRGYDTGKWGQYESEKNCERPVPYSVLLQELNHAKKQLEELYNLGIPTDSDSVSRLKSLLKAKTETKSESERRLISGDFNEELQVAREAIASLRTMFRESDPGHHILDTLDQCINIIVEKASNSTPSVTSNTNESSTKNTAVSLAADSGKPSAEETEKQPPTTKIIYFMPRSATPFMTSVGKPVGQVTLRDFKAVFDRPGFYRYHIKNTDTEYGMVKEEISEDDRVLPGNSGKIVLWVEEE